MMSHVMSQKTSLFLSGFYTLMAATLLSSCGSLPKLPTVPLNVPFIGDSSATAANDPFLPYDIRQKLVAGHTLDVDIYLGQRSPDRIFSGKVLIDAEGNGSFGKVGKTRLAGLDATQAVRAISSLFNVKRGDKILNVQLKNIEDLPLLTVNGSVKQPAVVRWFDSANPDNILPYVGGRTGGGSAVYITREGRRHFYPTLQAAVSSGTLSAGDIVTYTSDL
jgi:hypothetical protein